MPTYQYIAVSSAEACEYCRPGFEITQKMSDEVLTQCPKCGKPVRRVIAAVGISTRPSSKSILSDANLKRHGFTRLVKERKGVYRKT